MTAALRPSLRDCLLVALVYIATVWASVWLLRHSLAGAATWLRTLIVLVPVLPMVVAIRTVVKIVLAGDELQRRIDLEAIAMAALAVGIGSLTLSLLMVVKVVDISGRTALVWVLPVLWVGYTLARLWAARRYR
jgi:hypothetical protein